jgi:hypothetical protein
MHNNDHQPVIVSVSTPTLLRYFEASEDIGEKLGLSPGPEFLMSLAIEHEDPFELSGLCIAEIIEALRETHTAH